MSRSVRGPDYSLRIVEKHPVADAYRVHGSFTPYAIVGVDKRFSDGELAAEFWAAVADANRVMGNERRAGKSHAIKVANTLHRFATLPHYDS